MRRMFALLFVALAAPASAQWFAEDTAHQSGHFGTFQLCVRKDTATALAGTDGDYIPCIVDASGRLWINVGAIQAGDNVIGRVKLSDGTDLADVTAANALKVDGSAVTQPVSAASLPLPTGAATAANQDGIVKDGAGDTTQANVSSGRLHVDGSGVTQPVSGTVTANAGSGFATNTQYTEADTDTTITGTAVMWEDTSDTLRAVSSAKPLPVNVVAGGAGDGAIQDGASPSIEATVLDFTNSNPLAVRLTDTNGDYVAAGAGTQYTEDAAAAADPTGGVLIMVRDDALSGQTTTDGDNVAARGTDKGELYVKHVDSVTVTDGSGALNVIVDSGTTAVTQATASSLNAEVQGDAADGAAVSGNPVRVGGKDGSGNTQDIATDTSGELQVDVLTLPSVTIGTFPDNEPFNLNQVAGTTASTGIGVAGTGTLRVTVAHDSDVCNAKNTSQVAVAVSASGNTELVALTSSQTIYVCDVVLVASGTVAAQLIYGTGSACATGETDMTGPMDLTAQAGFSNSPMGRLKTAEANALCIELGGAVAVNGYVTYRKANTF